MITLGPRFAVLVAGLIPVAAIVAQLTQSWVLGLATAVGTTVVVATIDLMRAGSPDSIEVDRQLPASIVLGASAELHWHLSNQSQRRRSVRVADDLAPSLMATRRVEVILPPGGIADVAVLVEPTRRGRFTPTNLTVRVEGPWRIMARQRDRHLPAVMKVVPSFKSKREVELRLHRARLLEVGARSVRARGGGTEFDHLREYTVDDSYRHLDWAATARSGHAIVRSYRAEQHQTVVVMLDNGRVMAARSGGVSRLEHGMDAVMALATVSSRVGDRLGLMTFDREPHRLVAPGRGNRHMGVLTEAMFDLEPRLSESDYDRAVSSLMARFRRRVTVVVLTDLVGPVVEGALGPAVGALLTRHRVVVGAVTNSDVAQWSRRVPEGPEEAYATGAALISIDQRLSARRVLERLGAAVVDVEAGRLGPDLVDHYLEAKARGR